MHVFSARHGFTWLAAGKPKILKSIATFLAISFLTLQTGIAPVLAATEPYQAQVSAGVVTMAPGENKQITLKFKNIGTKTWTGGKTATSVYLYGNSSIFGHTSWLKNDQPAAIREAKVAPGAMASAVFSVHAPETPGTYTERFLLSYAPGSWVKGSVVTVTFTVAKPVPVPVVISAPSATDAVPASSEWKASLVDKGGVEWQILPLDHSLVTLTFKNTGTKTWKREGTGYVSLYTWSPKYRKSGFKDSTWKSDTQAATLVESEVKPGQTGTFRLELRAPEVPGKYQEVFQLAAEDVAWIDGGSVSFPIAVGTPDSYIAKGVTPGATSPVSGTYSTVLLLASQKNIALPGNDRLQLTNGFKNNGTAVWNSRTLQLVGVESTLGISSTIRDDSWPSNVEAVKATGATAPGEIGFVTYTIKAPPKKGAYTARFKLLADGQEVDGGQIEIPITVTADGYVDPTPISVPGPTVSSGGAVPPLSGDVSTLPNEPIIRVGLYRTTDDTLMVRSLSGSLLVQQNGVTVCTLAQGEIATEVYERSTRTYKVSGAGCSSQSPGWYVMVAADGVAPLEITDYSRPVAWLPGANDNKFRSKLELRFSPATDAVWVINELLLETYLKGIAETSNVSPLEYQKALLTAARTYALYHVNRGTKHANEYFHVDAHLDQVYRGFGQEDRSPNIVDGVLKTRGQIVTYDGKLAITPYFSRSDGRTRNWTEVWGGTGYPWLKSVAVPHDIGQTLWGHGVGLSARGALYMASKDGALYDAILKHFYTGIELRQAYQ
jgi:hypothetical protein